MTPIILERRFDPPRTIQTTYAAIRESGWCFELYRVAWRGSFLSADGTSMVCWFEAPDVESARTAARRSGADTSVMWNASLHEAVRPAEPNVLVARSFAQPATLEALKSLEDAGAHCLEARHVAPVRSFFSREQRRMLCLYAAPDAESVRAAQREAKLPFDEAWAFRRIGPDTLAAAAS